MPSSRKASELTIEAIYAARGPRERTTWGTCSPLGEESTPDEGERARLISDLTRLIREPRMPEQTRTAGLTLIGWLARRMPGEAPHALGVAEAQSESERRLARRASASAEPRAIGAKSLTRHEPKGLCARHSSRAARRGQCRGTHDAAEAEAGDRVRGPRGRVRRKRASAARAPPRRRRAPGRVRARARCAPASWQRAAYPSEPRPWSGRGSCRLARGGRWSRRRAGDRLAGRGHALRRHARRRSRRACAVRRTAALDAKLGDRAYATPLVADDGTIFVGSDAKKLLALDPSAGSVVFQLETDGEVDTAPVLARDGTILVAAGTQVLAVRRGGDVAWRYAARKKIFTAPALTANGLVIVGGQDHRVRALGPGGTEVWSTDLGADVDGGAAIGDDGGIHVGTDAGEIVRLDDKGVVTWRANVGGFVRGSLAIARNGDVVAGTYGPIPRVVRVGPDGFVRGAFAIAGTGAKEFGIHGGPLEDADGVLYFGTQDDGAYALDREGAVRWRFSTGGDVDAPLTLLTDGSLIVPSEDGTVTLLMP